MTQDQITKYDDAKALILERLGSFDTISKLLYSHSDCHAATTTIWRWFETRNIPPAYVIALWELSGSDFDVFDLLPWLRKSMPKLIEAFNRDR